MRPLLQKNEAKKKLKTIIPIAKCVYSELILSLDQSKSDDPYVDEILKITKTNMFKFIAYLIANVIKIDYGIGLRQLSAIKHLSIRYKLEFECQVTAEMIFSQQIGILLTNEEDDLSEAISKLVNKLYADDLLDDINVYELALKKLDEKSLELFISQIHLNYN